MRPTPTSFKAALKALAGDFQLVFSSVDADAPQPAHRRASPPPDRTSTRPSPLVKDADRDDVNSRRSQAIERGAGGAPLRAPSRIRPATRGDAPEIVDLLNACDVAEVG